MARKVPIHATRSNDVIAYAWVDDKDYAQVSTYRWLMQGTADAPRFVHRYRTRHERGRHDAKTVSLPQQLLGRHQRITYRNNNPLDCRRENLVRHQDRAARHQRSATALAAATSADAPVSGAIYDVPLTQGWMAWIDPALAERVVAYRWNVQLRRSYAFAQRRAYRSGGRSKVVYLARVVMGLQSIEDGETLADGVVALRTPPNLTHRTIDLRAANLLVTTRGGANLQRSTKAQYRGVSKQGMRFRAYIRLGGYDRVIGLYDTPADAARARDAEIVRLGLQDIARLNER